MQKICETADPLLARPQAAAVQELPVPAERGGRRLRRAGAPQFHRADRSRRDLPRWARRAGRRLRHAAGPDQPRVLPHLERQALRPAEFAHYDYSGENYTQLLWFFEGFTSYYDDLLLRRAGLIDDATYLKLLTKTCNQVLQTPGREVQSVAQASFDAWVKYYRQDENTRQRHRQLLHQGRAGGAVLRPDAAAEGQDHLDDVMRALWVRCKAGPMAEADFAAVLKELGGRASRASWRPGCTARASCR
jgi:hypothetical protein